MENSKKNFNIWGALLSIGIAESVGALSALLSGNFGETYTNIQLPPFSPPGAVFPIVWTALYAIMGLAAYLVFIESECKYKNSGLWLYAIQLLFNFSWSIIFFRFFAYNAAYVIICLLIVFAVLSAENFRRCSRLAGRLMIPYIIWILFAAYLNAGVAVLNA